MHVEAERVPRAANQETAKVLLDAHSEKAPQIYILPRRMLTGNPAGWGSVKNPFKTWFLITLIFLSASSIGVASGDGPGGAALLSNTAKISELVGGLVSDVHSVRSSLDPHSYVPYSVANEGTAPSTDGSGGRGAQPGIFGFPGIVLGTDDLGTTLDKIGDCDPEKHGVCCVMPNYCVPVATCSSKKVTTNLLEILKSVPTCTCPRGYRGDGRRQGSGCVNVDECASGEALCQQICKDLTPGYACGCEFGFRLLQDGYTCEDVDECAEGISGCSHGCENHQGGFACSCPSGFVLGENGKTCNDVDECELMREAVAGAGAAASPAEPGSDAIGGGRRRHLLDRNLLLEQIRGGGYAGAGERFAGSSVPRAGFESVDWSGLQICEYVELCENLPGGYRCRCPFGLKVDPLRPTHCVDVDECEEGARTDLSLGLPAAVCVKPPQAEGEGRSAGPGVTTPAWLTPLQTPLPSAAAATAVGAGTSSQVCVNRQGYFACDCAPGFVAVDTAPGYDARLGRAALEEEYFASRAVAWAVAERNAAYAVFSENAAALQCVDVDECAADVDPCNAGGEGASLGMPPIAVKELFEEDEGGFRHRYVEESGGRRMDVETIANAGSGGDGGGGVLAINDAAVSPGAALVPADGFAVPSASRRVLPIMIDTDAAELLLRMAQGPEGGAGQQQALQRLQAALVLDAGTGAGGAAALPAWRRRRRLAAGASGVPVSWQRAAMSPPAPNPRAQCVNTVGSFRCECPPGYEFRSGRCEDIDECSRAGVGRHASAGSLLCNEAAGEVCVNVPGSFGCACAPGWRQTLGPSTGISVEGLQPLQCVDVDECSEGGVARCSHGCVNTRGGYFCACPRGYAADDLGVCVDVDECALGACAPGVPCINLQGSFVCGCGVGETVGGRGGAAVGGGAGAGALASALALPVELRRWIANAPTARSDGSLLTWEEDWSVPPLGKALHALRRALRALTGCAPMPGACVAVAAAVGRESLCPGSSVCEDAGDGSGGFGCKCATGYELGGRGEKTPVLPPPPLAAAGRRPVPAPAPAFPFPAPLLGGLFGGGVLPILTGRSLAAVEGDEETELFGNGMDGEEVAVLRGSILPPAEAELMLKLGYAERVSGDSRVALRVPPWVALSVDWARFVRSGGADSGATCVDIDECAAGREGAGALGGPVCPAAMTPCCLNSEGGFKCLPVKVPLFGRPHCPVVGGRMTVDMREGGH